MTKQMVIDFGRSSTASSANHFLDSALQRFQVCFLQSTSTSGISTLWLWLPGWREQTIQLSEKTFGGAPTRPYLRHRLHSDPPHPTPYCSPFPLFLTNGMFPVNIMFPSPILIPSHPLYLLYNIQNKHTEKTQSIQGMVVCIQSGQIRLWDKIENKMFFCEGVNVCVGGK